VGTALSSSAVALLRSTGSVPDLDYQLVHVDLVLPVLTVALTTWAAAWAGSRSVLNVSPIQATGAAVAVDHAALRSRRGRNSVAIGAFAVGMGAMVAGIVIGMHDPRGLFVSVFGGAVSFTGVVVGADLVMPWMLRVVGLAFGSGATSRLAAGNAVRHPERSARNSIGLVIAVTLVTMFIVAIGSYQTMIRHAQAEDPAYYRGIDQMLDVTVLVLSALAGFSAVIAAIGMISNLSLSVLQRTRELGLLRALGFTAAQIRRVILIESAQLTGASVSVGLGFGTLYGWAGAQSLLGSIHGSPGVVAPHLPWELAAGAIAGGGLLTWAASLLPSRRATMISPVAALAVK
jgi:putative ABC transport system permease protein